MTPQQVAKFMQMQPQQQQQLANNQQILSNTDKSAAASENPPISTNTAATATIAASTADGWRRLNSDIQRRPSQPRIATGSQTHNFAIPQDSQQKLGGIGVPSDKLVSWNEVISWLKLRLKDAFKANSINDYQYNKVKDE